METAVNPWKSKWGRIMWMFELWENGYHLDLIYWICNTKHLSLSFYMFLSGWSVQDGMMRKRNFSELKHLKSQMAVSSVWWKERWERRKERESENFLQKQIFLNIYKGIFTAIKTCCDSYLVLKCVCVRWWESLQTHTHCSHAELDALLS